MTVYKDMIEIKALSKLFECMVFDYKQLIWMHGLFYKQITLP